MDFVEINKITQKSRVDSARDNMYRSKFVNQDDAVILIIYACRKMYGLGHTTKLIKALGINKIKCNL